MYFPERCWPTQSESTFVIRRPGWRPREWCVGDRETLLLSTLFNAVAASSWELYEGEMEAILSKRNLKWQCLAGLAAPVNDYHIWLAERASNNSCGSTLSAVSPKGKRNYGMASNNKPMIISATTATAKLPANAQSLWRFDLFTASHLEKLLLKCRFIWERGLL